MEQTKNTRAQEIQQELERLEARASEIRRRIQELRKESIPLSRCRAGEDPARCDDQAAG